MTDTYKFTKEDFESYRNQVANSIKVHKMSLMSDEAIIKWLDKKIKEL